MVSEAVKQSSIATLERIESLRREAGVPKAAMYKATGTSASAMSQWRSGLTKPSMRSLYALAEFFHVSVDYLMFGKKETAAPKGDGLREITDFLLSLPRERLHGILLALEAPQEVLDALNQLKP